ncbi:MAG: alanine--glyoxylate aminotransferase family protein, partial [Acidobacteria bacterium]|nr:alanine--glyoxylate aminotransferase family protein [Acidobacteriota bacterium]
MSEKTCVFHPPARLLLGPGPSMVDYRVYQAMAAPVVGHLDPACFAVMADLQRMLRYAFGTGSKFVMALSGTGTSGMEAAVSNFVGPGDEVAVFVNGYFGERICDMVERWGGKLRRFDAPWGEAFAPDRLRQALDGLKPKMVAIVMAETSTGVRNPVAELAQAAHERGALLLVDAVTALGAMPVEFDAVGIDICYSCTQKGLGAPPGLSPLALSDRAVAVLHARSRKPPAWYLDLQLLEAYWFEPHRYHHTVPISMYYALREALRLIEEETIEARFARHRRHHLAFVAGVEAMGLEMLVRAEDRLWSLNTVRAPAAVDDARVRKSLLEKFNTEISGGFGPLAGKIFRIGLMGSSSTAENVR